MKTNNYRHGDIALIQIEELPKGLKASKTRILLQNGSGGHPHSFDKGIFYPQEDGQIIGYLKAKNTMLFHTEHSPDGGKIEDGIYEIRRQREYTHQGFIPVKD